MPCGLVAQLADGRLGRGARRFAGFLGDRIGGQPKLAKLVRAGLAGGVGGFARGACHPVGIRAEQLALAAAGGDQSGEQGADIAEDAVDAVRKRPVAASTAGAAIGLFIAREPLMDLAGKLMSSKPKAKPAKARRTKPKAAKAQVEKVDE